MVKRFRTGCLFVGEHPLDPEWAAKYSANSFDVALVCIGVRAPNETVDSIEVAKPDQRRKNADSIKRTITHFLQLQTRQAAAATSTAVPRRRRGDKVRTRYRWSMPMDLDYVR